MKHKETSHTNTTNLCYVLLGKQKVRKDRLSIEYTSIHTDGISHRSAASGTRSANFKINSEHSKISEI
jgi:hypothetical protein